MRKIDFLKNSVFIRRINTDIDTELKNSLLNNLFSKVIENNNPDFKFEILSFYIDKEKGVNKYGRIISDNPIQKAYDFRGIYDGKLNINRNGEIQFENNYYSYESLNFTSDHFLDLRLIRRNKSNNEVIKLLYNMLII
ncbi:hypothetical protein ACFO3U_01045 [Flavobacterium ponti]|uniref:Uncharacterized protein n=1 Tax=Flavobacterium ponti TaxID=665133 RepID=A0ABV9NYY9_9FLAO